MTLDLGSLGAGTIRQEDQEGKLEKALAFFSLITDAARAQRCACRTEQNQVEPENPRVSAGLTRPTKFTTLYTPHSHHFLSCPTRSNRLNSLRLWQNRDKTPSSWALSMPKFGRPSLAFRFSFQQYFPLRLQLRWMYNAWRPRRQNASAG